MIKKTLCTTAMITVALVAALATVNVNTKASINTQQYIPSRSTEDVKYIIPVVEGKKVQPKVTPEVELMARLIHGEAGCEPFSGKVAVATVVMNRLDTKYMKAKSLKEVIYQHGQFDCVSNKASMFHREKPTKDDYMAAHIVINEGYRAFDKDVLYFYNPKISTDRGFINSVSKVSKIGRHVFAKNN